MNKIIILSNESGSGHKQTAKVLTNSLRREDRSIRTLSTFNELFIDLDVGHKWFGCSGESLYNTVILKKEASPLLYRSFFGMINYLYRIPQQKKLITRLKHFFEQEKPDLIISVIPIINHEIVTALEAQCPCIIIQTDLFEYEEESWFWSKCLPKGVWFVNDSHPYMLSGTEKGYQQALSYHADKHKVRQLSGTVIDPHFLQSKQLDVIAERQQLGFSSDKPVGMFLYGGYPPERVLKLAKELDKLTIDTQLIFICGNNKKLQDKLNQLNTRYKKLVIGYSSEVPYYMSISDFLVGKSGPGTIMESIALGLPLFLDTSHVMPHESHNAPWVEQQNLGIPFKTAKELSTCINGVTIANKSTTHHQPSFKNKAVFEVSDLVDEIL
jgi:1,2-diacylglycerol 3-beta-galactosyltransferase